MPRPITSAFEAHTAIMFPQRRAGDVAARRCNRITNCCYGCVTLTALVHFLLRNTIQHLFILKKNEKKKKRIISKNGDGVLHQPVMMGKRRVGKHRRIGMRKPSLPLKQWELFSKLEPLENECFL